MTQTQPGDRIELEDIRLKGEGSSLTLELERFEVFAPDAHVILNDGRSARKISPSGGVHFKGRIQGMPESLAVINIDRRGKISGLIDVGGHVWSLETPQSNLDAKMALDDRELALEPDASQNKPFACGTNDLPVGSEISSATSLPIQQAIPPIAAELPTGQNYQARIAIETDYELYQKFNSLPAINTYIANLFAYVSSLYERENQVRLILGNVYLYSTASASPWSSVAWSFSSTSAGLDKFRTYWIQNRSTVTRSTAHFLSGRALGGGIAYINALCNTAYGYGLSASLSGNVSTNQTIWDTLVVAHEIGHNFGSPHTHDYHNIGGDAKPVDSCYLGGPNGPYSPGYLPGLNSLSGGAPGTGAGTIMSYCHVLSGGYTNVTMTFGKNHPYGIKAYRVNDLIGGSVASKAAAYPNCLPVISSTNPILSVVKTGTGNGTVSSNPTGINCGTACSAGFGQGTNVTLNQSPAVGSVFTGWSGACSGTAACSVTMDASKSVTATFVSTGYVLTVNKTGTGTVTSSPAGINCGTACTASYASGTQVTLTAIPLSGWQFSGWGGACSGTGSCVVSMNAAKSVSATFTQATARYTLSVTKSGSGTITSNPAGITCGTDCSETYNGGTNVTLTATPLSGWQFSGWGGACSGTGSCVVSMNATKSVSATFTQATARYTLSVSKTNYRYGTVRSTPTGINCGTTCANQTAYFSSGTTLSLTATPISGRRFSNWSGACTGSGACNIPMNNNKTVTAVFR